MHPTLVNSGKQILKDLLAQCTDGQQLFFKRMYAPHDLELPINLVVDRIDEERISWAITQCENQVAKNKETPKP